MSGLFSKPKTVKAPPVEPTPLPPPIPTGGEEVGEEARRRRPRGFRGTFLTGAVIPGLLIPGEKDLKKSRLG